MTSGLQLGFRHCWLGSVVNFLSISDWNQITNQWFPISGSDSTFAGPALSINLLALVPVSCLPSMRRVYADGSFEVFFFVQSTRKTRKIRFTFYPFSLILNHFCLLPNWSRRENRWLPVSGSDSASVRSAMSISWLLIEIQWKIADCRSPARIPPGRSGSVVNFLLMSKENQIEIDDFWSPTWTPLLLVRLRRLFLIDF